MTGLGFEPEPGFLLCQSLVTYLNISWYLTPDLCFSETDLDQNTRLELTPASEQFFLLRGMRESRVGPSSSHEARNPAGPTETGQALDLPLPLTETGNLGTETR